MKLKPDQRVVYEVARLRAWHALDPFEPHVASTIAVAIWPNANFHGQGAGGAASRILKRMEKEGLAHWTCRESMNGRYRSWGWVRKGERPKEEYANQNDLRHPKRG